MFVLKIYGLELDKIGKFQVQILAVIFFAIKFLLISKMQVSIIFNHEYYS